MACRVPGSTGSPIWLHTASAVARLSPVSTITRMPASWQTSRACATSPLGGSWMPTTPSSVRPASSVRDGAVVPAGRVRLARARQRSALLLPHSST